MAQIMVFYRLSKMIPVLPFHLHLQRLWNIKLGKKTSKTWLHGTFPAKGSFAVARVLLDLISLFVALSNA